MIPHAQRKISPSERRPGSGFLLLCMMVSIVLGAVIAYRWRVRRQLTRGPLFEDGPSDDEPPPTVLAPVDEDVRAAPDGTSRRRVHRALVVGLVIVIVGAAGVVVARVGLEGHSRTAPPRVIPVSTLPPAPLEVLRATPPLATTLSSSGVLAVEFSESLAGHLPEPIISPAVTGTWSTDSSSLVFDPSGYFAPLTRYTLTIPGGRSGLRGSAGGWLSSSYTVTFSVPAPSVLRLQQLLAELGYLPLRFDPTPQATGATLERTAIFNSSVAPGVSVPSTSPMVATAQSATASEPADPGSTALDAQSGSFSWRYPSVPSSLASLWQPGVETALVRGAVMAFDSDHGFSDGGELTATFWARLFAAVAADQVTNGPYDYLEVSTSIPERLVVWRNGAVVFQSPANTGIADAPTAPGTYPVYARYVSTTMSGYNPNGSYYDDPGIPYVAYFNGGDAVHGFLRYTYGFPQSLGCVELPYSSAAVVFNYDPIGTLVHVA